MVELFVHYMAPIMFAALVLFLLLGYPVAFSLAANGLIFGLIGIELGLFRPDFLQALPERVYGVMNNETLLAIPFFTFMGLILERSGMAEDLLDTIGQLFGTIRGGLAYAVIFVGALLAATTGVVAASVISMGLISLPIMLRYGYDRRVATGVIAASGTLAQIIPPSLVLIVMADQLGRSVGDMYEGAFLPGLMLAGLYAGYVFIMTVFFPVSAPGLPKDAQRIHEDLALARRQGVFTGLGLFVVFPFGLLVLLGIYNLFASESGLLPAGSETVRLVLGGIGLALAAYALFAFGPKALGLVPRLNLLVLTTVSALIAYLMMQRTQVQGGADFVVLTMSLTVAIAFTLALLDRLLRIGILSKMTQEVTFVMVPPLALIFLVLGTIFIGVATPTEGGAMGATGAIALALMKRRLSWDLLRQATESTAKLSAFVVFILVGARVFSLTFYGVNGHKWVEELLVSLPGGQIGFLLFVNVFVFLLAFFLDFFELAFIVIPLIGPAAERLGIDLIWFGVMLGVNMQTSFMHPPFGFALFYLRSVAPRESYIDRVTKKRMEPVTTGQIYWGAVPFVLIQCIAVALVIAFPRLVTHYKGSGPQVDPSKVQIDIQQPDLPPPLDFTEPPKIQ
ncbi:MAG TPA: TRAP transporter large permease subunit [Xanthobacteraceae bacterium]|jgi:tripartite ATP-independent transporter DctM subunit|nr:TRAP transporter large permease subunit [Xanthobacteraceae bacterium]